ncbi:MAG: 4a-hydroxytetrahydrobiopterin dehydratase [Patescibacteria group bacterium]
MTDLASQKCVPCEGGTPPLESARVDELAKQINPAWAIVPATATDAMRIRRNFKFKNFVEAMKFVNRVAELAEAEGHHPDLHIFYNKVLIELWTHAVSGLSENDFILAAKIDQL